MAGYLKILRTDLATGTHGRTAEEYTLSYVTGSNTWVKTFDYEGLLTVLVHSIGLTRELAGDALHRAQRQGATTVPSVEISANDAQAMGLMQAPSDEG